MVFVIHLLSAEQQPPVFQIAAPFLEVSQGGRATIGEWGAWGRVWGSAHCHRAQVHLRATLGDNSLIQPEHHQGQTVSMKLAALGLGQLQNYLLFLY